MNAVAPYSTPKDAQSNRVVHVPGFEPDRTAAAAKRDAQARRSAALTDAAMAAAAVLMLAGGIAVLAAREA